MPYQFVADLSDKLSPVFFFKTNAVLIFTVVTLYDNMSITNFYCNRARLFSKITNIKCFQFSVFSQE